MSRMTSVLSLGVAVLFSAQVVQADEAGQAGKRQIPPKILEKFDKDGDGSLNETERGELRKAMEERRAEGKGPRGANGEGAKGARPGGKGEAGKGPRGLSEEKRAELLSKFDKNGDGKLDETEREAAKKEFAGRRGPAAGAGRKGPGGRGNMSPEKRAELMKRFDKNGDGTLDQAEREAAKKEFGGRRGPGARGKGRPGIPGSGRPAGRKPGVN